MADNSGRRPEAKWEPGTLDNTRKNIGTLSAEEAKKMMKVLGGEIYSEKSTPINYDALPKNREYAKRAVGGTPKARRQSESAPGGGEAAAGKEKPFVLPELPPKERQLMDRLMMADDYKIKPNYGLFNFVRRFKKNGMELLRKGFLEYSLPKNVDHLEEFIKAVQDLVAFVPDTYRTKIMEAQEDKFRFLKLTCTWSVKELRVLLVDLKAKADSAMAVDTVPFIRAAYKDLIKVYYLGENRVAGFFKEVYNDLLKYPRIDKKKASLFTKAGVSGWYYVYSGLIKGLYPLLMRICSNQFDYFQDFFLMQTPKILGFLDMNKFDLLLPGKKSERLEEAPVEEAESEESEEEVAEEKEEPKSPADKRKMAIVQSGLKLLDQLFPGAGFLHLETLPDMYPYFQPLYEFRDGYNMLAPDNPLQITVTLLRITEDLVQGCRNIMFTDDGNTDFDPKEKDRDRISTVLSEWFLYREELFDKYYGDQLRSFVNQEYSTQGDFKSSIYGKKLITSMLWQTKYNFLPHFEFTQLLLERPKNDSQYRPLCMRTEFLYNFLLDISRNIGAAAKTKGAVVGIANPWARYNFDIPNVMSKRMDVLLGAKRSPDETAATNANLVKYTLCIVAVLDWWINDASSPAYTTDTSHIYRISAKDGAPEFSAPIRSDQNDLFAEGVKAAIERKKQQGGAAESEPAQGAPEESAPAPEESAAAQESAPGEPQGGEPGEPCAEEPSAEGGSGTEEPADSSDAPADEPPLGAQ